MKNSRYDFDIMFQDIKIAEIRFKNNNLSIKKCFDGTWQFFHGDNENIQTIYYFLESRCYENGRADLPNILQQAGIDSNNPWEWCKVSHGVTWEDFYWIRLPGENITWKDVKIRD
ncbi:MAG: hypothetical protein SOZ48_09190 [Eubacterium sp.]|nr:hypothetical protein [Eubacterium sp.]